MLYTIGHSNHSIAHFLELLQRHGIESLYDVRSRPFSRFNPQFNRERLKASLEEAGIAYVFMGDRLGGRPEDPACYINGRLSYELQAKTPLFLEGLQCLRQDSRDQDIAIMCAEKAPQDCHRMNSIANHLMDIEVRHILADGSIVTQADLVKGRPEKLL